MITTQKTCGHFLVDFCLFCQTDSSEVSGFQKIWHNILEMANTDTDNSIKIWDSFLCKFEILYNIHFVHSKYKDVFLEYSSE